MPETVIEVDGLAVTVDADAYAADPQRVEQEVRDARVAVRLVDPAPAPDYDALVAEWGAGR